MIFLFVIFLLLDSIFLPALVGPREFLVMPVFVMSFLVNSENRKSALILGLIFSFVAGLLSNDQPGTAMAAYLATFLVFIWLTRFFDTAGTLKGAFSFRSLAKFVITAVLLVYCYSWFYIFISSDYSLVKVFREWPALLQGGILVSTIIWSAIMGVLFRKYPSLIT